MLRVVVLLPNFKNEDIISKIRNNYDPLSEYIAPHITIVFPFESDLTTEALKKNFDKVLNGTESFSIKLKDFTGDYRDGYLFLNVKNGNDKIIEIHDKLYTGLFKSFLNRKLTYCPHLTVGRLSENTQFNNAIEELTFLDESFETIIKKVFVINIDNNETSSIEFSFDLK